MSAVAADPFRRASFDAVDRSQIPALVYRFLRSRIRPAIRQGRWDKAWNALANDQGPKLAERDIELFDEHFGELLHALDSANRSSGSEQRDESRAEAVALVKRLVSSVRIRATAARRAWKPKPRTRWTPQQDRPKRSREEWAEERAARAQHRAEQSVLTSAHQDALEEERAALPWGSPIPKRLWSWNSRKSG